MRIGNGDAAFKAYGMPYWNARQGGYAMGNLDRRSIVRGLLGLGDTTCDVEGNCYDSGPTVYPTDTNPGQIGGGNIVNTSPSSFPSIFNNTPPSSLVSTISNVAQQGFNDAFSILKLFNPVPPGTTIVTNPQTGYTYMSAAGSGQAAPGMPGLPGSFNLGSLLPFLLIGGVALLVLNR